MEIRLLKKGYMNNEEFYKAFLNDQLKDNDEFFSNETVVINEAPNFPIYINVGDKENRDKLYHESFNIISKYYIDTDREIHFNELFWHSLLCGYKREYILENYPKVKDSISEFNKIVVKKFNWESYIYKFILCVQYINDNISDDVERKRYYQNIIDNLDLFNYIIKYEIFRNDKFLINILDIIHEHDLSKIMKAKIKDRDDLGKDERVGRRVIFEFNKSYPVVMAPMLEKDELEPIFFEYLGYYCDLSKIEVLV